MDNLQEIIASLSENQQKDFVSFIQRNKYRKDRKDLKLFELLRGNNKLSAQEFTKQLKCSNQNAYHTIRKRLFKHLSDFIVLQASTQDATQGSHIGTLLSVVLYLFDKGLNTHAWKYLQIAEALAFKHNYFDYLHSIYLLQMEKAFLNTNIDFEQLYQKYQANKIHLEQSEKVQIACALLRKELQKVAQLQKVLNFTTVLNKVLNDLGVNQNVLSKPRTALIFVQTLREIAFSSKNFLAFENFVVKIIQNLQLAPNNLTPEVASELQFYLAHVQFRNRKFQNAAETLANAKKLFQQSPPVFQKKFDTKVLQLNASIQLFTNELEKAIQSLNSIITNPKVTQKEQHNALVNLGVCYFVNNEPKKTLHCLNQFSHTDNWYQKTMGMEWVLKKQLMEILLFAELEYIDVVESRIKAFKRKFKVVEQHPIYHRVFGFLKIIDQILQLKPVHDLKTSIEKHIVFLNNEEEDLQAMAFYAWVKAKISNKNYYQTLLELVTR